MKDALLGRLYMSLERALRALASSSGGAARPGVPGVNPGGHPGGHPGGQGVIPRRFKRKKFFVTDGRTDGRTDGQT